MTSAQLARGTGSETALAVRRAVWSDEQWDALLDMLMPGKKDQVTPAIMQQFAEACGRTGMDPFLRQIYLIPTTQGPRIHVGIDGHRLIASRAGVDATDGPYFYDAKAKQWTDVWVSATPPDAAKYGIRRPGATGFIYGQVGYREFKGKGPNWEDRPAHQLAIVAERHAIRKAYQHDLAATTKQLQQAAPTMAVVLEDDDPTPPRAIEAPQARVRLSAPAPAPEPEYDAAPHPAAEWEATPEPEPVRQQQAVQRPAPENAATEKQLGFIRKMLREAGRNVDENALAAMTRLDASKYIEELRGQG